MILVDSSIWIDHFRRADATLQEILTAGQVVVHPFIIGEIALGHVRPRGVILDMLRNLPQVLVAEEEEMIGFIEKQKLFGLGIGYIDAHLLAAARMSSARLWTRDKILQRAAIDLRLAYQEH